MTINVINTLINLTVDQLKKQLSIPRIERLSGRALGEWDDEAEAVRVVRKDGKFGTFGYSFNGEHYLEYYEAMFLLEVVCIFRIIVLL